MTSSSPPTERQETTERQGPSTADHRLYRHRSDVARLAFNLVLLSGFMALAELSPGGVRSLSSDVLRLVNRLPAALVEGVLGAIQLVAVATPAVAVALLVWRHRFALLGVLGAAGAFAAALMAVLSGRLQSTVPVDQTDFERYSSWFVGNQFPSSTYLCAATAVIVAAGPWLARRWRRAGWIFIAATVTARVLSAIEVPIRIGVLLTLGAACGSLALVMLGAPRRRVDEQAVCSALRRSGLSVEQVHAGTVDDGIPTFCVVGNDGERWSVRAFGRDERDGDLLLTTWQRLSRRGLGDQVLTGAPRRLVEREALALALFSSAGVRAPTPIAATQTPDEVALLVTSAVEGRRLAELGEDHDELTDEVLDSIWSAVERLQLRRLAHRRLDLDHIVLTSDGPVLTDLRRASIDASDEVLGADVAELLAALSVVVGAERAIAAAVRSLSADHLARAVPLVQLVVLSPVTRSAFTKDKKALSTLRNQLAEAAGVSEVELAPVRRVSIKGTISMVGSLVLGYYLLSLAAEWDQIWSTFADAQLTYVVPILVLTGGGYVALAANLMGSVTTRLALLPTTAVMFAQSYLNRFTPANAGGMAMRVRYLQLNGMDTTVAAAAIGLSTISSGIAQVLLIGVFVAWGGSSGTFDFALPDTSTVLAAVLAVGLVASAVLYTSWGRSRIRPWIHGALSKVVNSSKELAADPTKLALLMGGALISKLTAVVSFWLSVLAFGVDMHFGVAGALFMVANTIGSAVPTPGGVGGIEAALTAALVGAGVDSATAAAIVLLYRILTYWLPTLPSYGFLQYTQRARIV